MAVRAGSGWPGDPATDDTPVADGPVSVRHLARTAATMAETDARISVCRACPRLVAWREEVAVVRKRAYADQDYWGRPVPGFGPAQPRIIVAGLAPSAHGANRTGRNFTGDRSGDWLYAALHRAGLANQPISTHAGDGLALAHTRVVGAVRCAPPANLPTLEERDTCRPWLTRQLELAWPSVRCLVALGGIGWTGLWSGLRETGVDLPARMTPFGHGVRVGLPGDRLLLGCYHVSPQNTSTRRLTEAMLDDVFDTAREWAGLPHPADLGVVAS